MVTPLVRPARIVEPFAKSGSKNTIPQAPSGTPGAASLDLGFPPPTMQSIQTGGVPPSGLDFNGILNLITQHTAWVAAGGQFVFDATLSAFIGGYPKGSILQDNNSVASYRSMADNNTTDFNSTPSSIGTLWEAVDQTSSGLFCGTSTGSANAQILTPTVPLPAYRQGVSLSFIAGFTNTGALTVNVSGLGVRNVYKDGPTGPVALTGGEIVVGNIINMRDDGTRFQLTATELGTAALANASSNTGIVAAVSGAVQINHLAVFSNTIGTLVDGGPAGVAPAPAFINSATTIATGVFECDTTSGPFSVTLPGSPVLGSTCEFIDPFGTWGTNNLTILRNGSTIVGSATDLICNISGEEFRLIYNGTTWKAQ